MAVVTRFGVSLEETLLQQFDRLIHHKGYSNRSEALRDLIRESLVREQWELGTAETVGVSGVGWEAVSTTGVETSCEACIRQASETVNKTSIAILEKFFRMVNLHKKQFQIMFFVIGIFTIKYYTKNSKSKQKRSQPCKTQLPQTSPNNSQAFLV